MTFRLIFPGFPDRGAILALFGLVATTFTRERPPWTADYIHLASTITIKASEFLTTDGGLLDQAARIAALGIRPVVPSFTSVLPDHYRQGDLLLDDKIAILGTQASGSGKAVITSRFVETARALECDEDEVAGDQRQRTAFRS
jgi:hypothetical protein